MIRSKCIFVLIFFISLNKFYTQINFNWAKDFQGNYSTGKDITLDGNGNLYTVGTYSGSADFDPGPSTFTLSGSGVYLTKFDTLGNFIWAKTIADGNAYVSNVKVDVSGNVFVFGGFSGIVDFDPTPSSLNLSGGGSIYISKLNSAGIFLWTKQINANYGFSARVMTLDFSGNIIFAGVFSNTVDFDPGISAYNLTANTHNIYIAKLDNSGNFIWAHNIIGAPFNADFPTGITADNLGNIYYTFLGTGDVDFGPAVYNVGSASVCKIDANANFVWAKSFAVNPRAVAVNSLLEVFFTGWFFGTTDFDPGPATYNLTPAGFDDAFVCKLTSSGNLSWAQNVGGSGQEKSHSIILDANSNSYIGGELFYAKVNSAGNFEWAKQISPPAIQSFGNGIAIDLNNNFYATGNLSGTGDFDPGPNTYTLSSVTPTISEAFIFRWSPCTSTISPPNNITNISNQTFCSNNSTTLSFNGIPQINWYDYPNSPTVIGTGSTFITPTLSAGTYTFYAESNACSVGKTPITVTVNSSPTITINSGSICTGQSFTLNPTGANTYTYSSGTNIVSPSSTTSYSVIGTSVNGCVSSNTAVSSVTVNPSPTITVASGAICSGGSFTITPSGANTYTYSSGTNIVSPSSTTFYSVTGTSALGCASSNIAVATVSVQTSLTVSIAGSTISCSGQPLNLTANGAATYSWSTGSTNNAIAPTPTANTTYSVIGSSASCSNNAVISVSVVSMPTVTAITNASLICTGQSATITANGANTYSWNTNSTNTTIVVSPTVNTTYTVTGTDANGCADFATVTQSVSLCTGIEKQNKNGSIKIYPNPSKEVFNLSCDCLDEKNVVEVYNTLGQLILSKRIFSENTEIDLSSHAGGLYYVKVKTQSGEEIIKIIKE